MGLPHSRGIGGRPGSAQRNSAFEPMLVLEDDVWRPLCVEPLTPSRRMLPRELIDALSTGELLAEYCGMRVGFMLALPMSASGCVAETGVDKEVAGEIVVAHMPRSRDFGNETVKQCV